MDAQTINTQAYWYCINEPIPNDVTKKGCYIYYLNEYNQRVIVSPIFPDTMKLKLWKQDKFEAEPYTKDKDGTWSSYQVFRLKKINDNKKTQKINLPKVIEINIEPSVPKIKKDDEYIVLMAGRID